MRLRNGYPDRRRSDRGTAATEPGRQHLVTMILGTFHEMPGLCLHANQAARLFGLRPATCQVVLDDLVATGKLRRGNDGQYLAAERESRSAPPIPSRAMAPAKGIVRRGY